LLSGVTTVCHHNPLHKPLRRNYPLRVVAEYGFCHSLFRGDDAWTSYRETNSNHPWIIHLAEGIDAEAAAEFDQLDRLGLLQPNTVLVHGVGLAAAQRRALIERGGGLIWCSGSNVFLFGQTACVSDLAQAGKLALGSDSRLSGEFDLLAELRVAHETGQLSPRDLFQLVTLNPARLLRLRAGGPADFVLLPPPTGADPFAHLLSLTRADLDLVMLAGKPIVGSPRMQPSFTATKTKATSVWVDQVEKLLAQHLAERLQKSSVQEPGLILTAP
jgi:cytosine/adenosine deaminase-related metal-dependent hydrolase